MTRHAILALAAAVLAGDEALGRVAGGDHVLLRAADRVVPGTIGVVVERDASTASST